MYPDGRSMADDVDAFMATMLMHSHPLALEQVVRVVRDHYGLEAHAARLTGERDENFRLHSAEGTHYVFKVAHPAEPGEVSELTTAALLHLQREDPTLPCPRVVRALSGETCVRFRTAGGFTRTARLLTYLPGEPLLASSGSAARRAACGRLGARLTHALRSFTHPGAHRAVVWDVRHVGRLARLLQAVPGFPCTPAALALLERIVPRIEAQFPSLRQQVVHNDLNPRNILATPAGELSGIIDFGDMAHTAIIADVAVTAAEHIPEDCTAGGGAAAQSVRDVADAYHESLPLAPAERALLGTLVAARLTANLVVHEWHLHHNPAGEHYRPLAAEFMRERLAIGTELSLGAKRP
ncbi:MAG: phosphotransferase [Gammaproteobacteria bacterium]|nr:phosphotransferase [Gammaproteobacteria bacterium]